MVRIPEAQERIGISPQGAGVAPSIAQSRQLGEGIAEIGASLLELERESQEADAKAYKTTKLAELDMFATERSEQLKTEIEDIDKYTETFMSDYNKRFDEIVTNAPNDIARQMIAEKGLEKQASYFGKATQFQATQKIALQKQGFNNTVGTYANIVRADPTRLDEITTTLQEDLQDARAYTTPDEFAELAKNTSNALAEAHVRAFIDRKQADEAMDLLQQEEYQIALDQETYASLINAVSDEYLNESVDIEIGGVLSGERIADPTNKETQKKVDIYYENNKETLQVSDLITLSANAKMPTPFKRQVNAQLLNGSPQEQMQAAEIMQSIVDQNPTAIHNFGNMERKRATLLLQYRDAGVPESRAVEWVNKQVEEKPDTVMRAAEAKESEVGSVSRLEDLAGDADPNFFFDVPVSAAMQADFATTSRGYYVYENMNQEASEKRAFTEMRSRWGVTNIGGQRWQKYAPEAVYRVKGQDPEWIQEQLVEEVSAEGIAMQQIGEETIFADVKVREDLKDNLYLQIVPGDERSAQPRYQVFTQNESGELIPIYTRVGELMAFRPQYNISPAYKRRVAETPTSEELLNKARESRAKALDLQKLMTSPRRNRANRAN